jgi:hypothetical protein
MISFDIGIVIVVARLKSGPVVPQSRDVARLKSGPVVPQSREGHRVRRRRITIHDLSAQAPA